MIEIYTDGSSRGNPGPAGWGCVIFFNNKTIELGGASLCATNNQMGINRSIQTHFLFV